MAGVVLDRAMNVVAGASVTAGNNAINENAIRGELGLVPRMSYRNTAEIKPDASWRTPPTYPPMIPAPSQEQLEQALKQQDELDKRYPPDIKAGMFRYRRSSTGQVQQIAHESFP